MAFRQSLLFIMGNSARAVRRYRQVATSSCVSHLVRVVTFRHQAGFEA